MATGVIRAINSGINMAFTIPASSWTSTAPYTYSWLNSKVTDGSHVTVEFYSTNVNTETPYLEYEKISGGIQFTVPSKPSTDISVIAHIISAQDGPYADIDGTMVSTSAISGAANVTEALTLIPNLISDNIGIHQVYSNYSNATKTHTYNFSYNQEVMIIIGGWTGNPNNSGLYLSRLSINTGGSTTAIKAATGVTISQTTSALTIAVNNQWTSVKIFILV